MSPPRRKFPSEVHPGPIHPGGALIHCPAPFSDVYSFMTTPDYPRMLRGGSWFLNPRYCRSAYRSPFQPDAASGHFGFRVVCLPQEVTP